MTQSREGGNDGFPILPGGNRGQQPLKDEIQPRGLRIRLYTRATYSVATQAASGESGRSGVGELRKTCCRTSFDQGCALVALHPCRSHGIAV